MLVDGMNKLSWPVGEIDPWGSVVVHAFESRLGYGNRQAAMGTRMGGIALAFRWENHDNREYAGRDLMSPALTKCHHTRMRDKMKMVIEWRNP